MSRGLNFSKSKYVIADENSFMPHIRSSFRASIPFPILNKFSFDYNKKNIALVSILSNGVETLRIKGLARNGNSLTISLKKEIIRQLAY